MDYYNTIKTKLLDNEINKKIKDYSKNKSDLQTYFDVGKLLIEAQGGEKRAKYGDSLIKEYTNKLKLEFNIKFNSRILWRARKFYLLFKNEKVSTMSTQLTWSHYVELLKFDDRNKINYYIYISIKYNFSVRELRMRIKNKEYERLDNSTKNKLIKNNNIKVSDFIKNPILIKNSYNYTEISEKILKKLILEDIDNFLKELGHGFCYIENEYKVKLGDRYNYIDLLLYNINFNCYVVVELKVIELKSEHIGQIQKYMNYIDKNIRNISQDKTIGIIICKKDNMYVLEYSSDDRIHSSMYNLI